MILQLKFTVKSQTVIHLMKHDTTVLSSWYGSSFHISYEEDDFCAKNLPEAKYQSLNKYNKNKYNKYNKSKYN
jgi:hypothetical protein